MRKKEIGLKQAKRPEGRSPILGPKKAERGIWRKSLF